MPRFDYFVVLAEMRTGSNFLETNINAFPDLRCFGEAFNPAFIGYPKSDNILGVSKQTRDQDPDALIKAVRSCTDGLGGFRYFHDHDQRVFDKIMHDKKCAKIVLTRNPAESYVSWKIAMETGQWKLTNGAKRKDARAHFDALEFNSYVQKLQDQQIRILNTLQRSGQTAFYIAYEDLQDISVINGLAQYLGSTHELESLEKSLKVQNPEPLSAKVSNFDDMEAALDGVDRFNLTRTPNFEPRRGPSVPTFVALNSAQLLYMPIASALDKTIRDWITTLSQAPDDLIQNFSQKTLRQWKRKNKKHKSFTVVSHPLDRAFDAFCNKIYDKRDDTFSQIRSQLKDDYGVILPSGDKSLSIEDFAASFIGFLRFLKANLSGQTPMRVDAHWASQYEIIQGFGNFCPPDHIIRDHNLESLRDIFGLDTTQVSRKRSGPFPLADIYTDQMETLIQDIYQKDYLMFGFKRWDRT